MAHAVVLVAFAFLLATVEGPAIVLCVALLVTALLTGRLRPVRLTPMLACILVWALAGVPGLIGAEVRPSSEDALRPLFALAFFVGAYVLPSSDDRTLRRAALAFGIGIVLNGAYGFLQLRYGALPLDRLLLKNPRSSQIWVPNHQLDPTQPNASGVRGLSGLFYNRLKLAHVGIVGLVLLALAALSPGTRRVVRVLSALGLAILAVAVVLTYARMALVALGVAVVIGALVGARLRTAVVALAALLGAVGVGWRLAGEQLVARFAALGSDLGHRVEIFRAALAMFRDHPLFGVGHGVYRTVAPRYYPADASAVWRIDAHDLLLHVLAETGVVGAAAFVGAVGLGLFRVGRRVRRDRASAEGGAFLDRLALVGLLGLLALGVTHFPLHHAPVALVFWTLLGVADGGPWPRAPVEK